MAVKVVTDSASDIPADVAEEMGITVVPLYVRFGDNVYRDGVDITTEEFYHRLAHDRDFPVSSTPTPAEFTEAYDKLAQETDEIISIHLSSKLSGTYNAALLGRERLEKRCRVEVVDSLSAIMGQGLLVIAAAKAAKAGANLDEVTDMVGRAIPRVHLRMAFDTLEYLKRGGRIGKAQALLGTILKVNPILTIKDGETFPVGRERSRAKAIEHLRNFVAGFSHIEELAIEYATTPDEMETLARRLEAVFPRERIYITEVGPLVGTHVGPHVLAVSVLEGEAK